MNIKDKDLYERLNLVLIECNKDKNIFEQVKQIMLEKNMLPGSVYGILSTNVPVQTIPDVETLFILTYALFRVTRNPLVNVEEIFTKIEIQKLISFKFDLEALTKDNYPKIPLKFLADNLSSDHWMTKMKMEDVAELFARNIIKYNKNTQRNTTVQKINGVMTESIYLNRKSVDEIKELMLNGQFISNAITINILSNGDDSITYDPGTRVLRLVSGELNIIDGFHRAVAMLELYREFPKLEYNTVVYFTNFPEDKARRYIKQENNRNIISKEHIKSLQTENLENIITRNLNDNSMSELQGKVTTNYPLISKGTSLVLFSTLENAIKANFKVVDKKDVITVTEFLTAGFNEILAVYKEEVKSKVRDILEGKEIKREIHPNTFIGYVAILSQLMGQEDWKDKLIESISSIDFSDDNDVWNIILDNKNIIPTMKIVKKISNKFKNVKEAD